MAHETLARTLWHLDKQDQRIDITQEQLADFAEPLVILGEAGIGKSSLLDQLAQWPGHAYCTARQLINHVEPQVLLGEATTLVIDALDEVAAHKDGDALDLVLQRLGQLGFPRFVLSCRTVDWRSATGTEAIREQYARPPLQLHLDPFSEAQILAFLEARLGATAAAAAVSHFNTRGLNGLLGNPQTLELIAAAAAGGILPDTRGQLFDLAVAKLIDEHKEAKLDLSLSRDMRLAAAGAACAGLILTGSESITRRSSQHMGEAELPLADLVQIPDGGHIATVLGSRLFKTIGPERFTYLHRRIGEYLAARWLSIQANTPRKRRRLLAIFHRHGLVPSSLRGLHAWLVQTPALASAAIASDPMGLIEYGDVDTLTTAQTRELLQALRQLARKDPHFSDWKTHAVRSLARADLIDDLREVITQAEEPFGLRLLVLESLEGAPVAKDLLEELKALMLLREEVYALRSAAAGALAGILPTQAWPSIVETLRDHDDEFSIRLALELMELVGYACFDDALIVSVVHTNTSKERLAHGLLYHLERGLPDIRLDGVLDSLAAMVKASGLPDKVGDNDELTDLVYGLIARRLEIGTVTAEQLWNWLEPFDVEEGYHKDSRKTLYDYLIANTSLRQAIQQQVMLTRPETDGVYQRAADLQQRSNALTFSDDDLISLMMGLDPSTRSDDDWRELILLVHHNEERGEAVRAAAAELLTERTELISWLESLPHPRIPQWQLEHDERQQQRIAEREDKYRQHREHYYQRITQMRAGELTTLTSPAKVYLGLFSDIDKNLPGVGRIAQWIGQELAEAALEGFAALLLNPPAFLNANEMAKTLAKGKYYEGAHILIAALAERQKHGISLDDLPDDSVLASFIELWRRGNHAHYGLDELKRQIDDELKARDLWPQAMRMILEPQLDARSEHPIGLGELMRDKGNVTLAVELATEWLGRWHDLPQQAEITMIDRLLQSGRHAELRKLAADRVKAATKSPHQKVWDAVGLIVDFENSSARLDTDAIKPSLIFEIRDRSFDERSERSASPIVWTVAQLEWIVSRFRNAWPHTPHPPGGWAGDQNPWDATDYLRRLIRRLGGDAGIEASAALARLSDAPEDDYTDTLLSVGAEQKRIRVEAAYVSPTLTTVGHIARDLPPASALDMQAWLVEELEVVQAKIRSDDAESWRGFYEQGKPRAEEDCRDHLMGLLRQGSPGVEFSPEGHVAANKEVDIACATGTVRLPIEIKGQWNSQLWEGADLQLDRLYTPDWRAGGYGIYLVLWFGEHTSPNKRIFSPGAGAQRSANPEEMKRMLIARSAAAREGRVAVVVLDVSRSQPPSQNKPASKKASAKKTAAPKTAPKKTAAKQVSTQTAQKRPGRKQSGRPKTP